jgi:hypothetical protein
MIFFLNSGSDGNDLTLRFDRCESCSNFLDEIILGWSHSDRQNCLSRPDLRCIVPGQDESHQGSGNGRCGNRPLNLQICDRKTLKTSSPIWRRTVIESTVLARSRLRADQAKMIEAEYVGPPGGAQSARRPLSTASTSGWSRSTEIKRREAAVVAWLIAWGRRGGLPDDPSLPLAPRLRSTTGRTQRVNIGRVAKWKWGRH